jgi:hypothetical protein
MKNKTLKTLTALLLLVAFTSTQAAVTGRSADSSIAGTEKLLSDSSGTDTYITVSTLLAAITSLSSPTITSPTISGATITTSTFNGNTWTAGSGILTIGAAKTLTASNTLTLTGTDGSSVAFGAGGTVAYQGVALSQFAATTSVQLAGVISNETGSGSLVFATSPTLVTPVLGVATATSINKVALTAPASSATLTIEDGKTLTASNTLTLTGTDGSSVAFGTGGTVAYTGGTLAQFAATTSAQLAGVISNETGSGVLVLATSPTLVTPTLGVATATSINKVTLTAPASGSTLTIADGKTLTASNTLTLAGTDSTTFTFPPTSNTVFVSSLASNDVDAANGLWGASNALVLEGATADGFETTLSPVDPTADQTVSIPNFAVNWAVIGSTLTTNNISAANSFWGASNALVFEGASADGSEITLSPADATADVIYLLPDAAAASYALMSSALTTNAANIANSVWGISNGLSFEGATADAHEITITPADATADVVYLLPNAAAASYSIMSSTLATNAPDIANSVTGASASLVFEGTADGFETSLTATDPTADRTVTIPNATGTVILAQASTATALTADNQAVTPGSNNRIQLSSDDATASNRTFTLSATGAITGQIYILIAPASNACELADTGIHVLSAAWSPNASDTLTLLFDGTNFIELARSAN